MAIAGSAIATATAIARHNVEEKEALALKALLAERDRLESRFHSWEFRAHASGKELAEIGARISELETLIAEARKQEKP